MPMIDNTDDDPASIIRCRYCNAPAEYAETGVERILPEFGESGLPQAVTSGEVIYLCGRCFREQGNDLKIS